jgi:cell division protein ZipA
MAVITLEMLIVGGVFLVLLAIIVMRTRAKRKRGYKMKAKVVRSAADQANDLIDDRELPNGGARVVDRIEPSFGDIDSPDETLPDHDQGYATPETLVSEPTVVPSDDVDSAQAIASSPEATAYTSPVIQPTVTSATPSAPGTVDWLDDVEVVPPAESAKLPRDEHTRVFSLNVVARSEHGFSGADILQALLGYGLRFGDMDFFHFSEIQSGTSKIQFSVANMMQPGVFDIDLMDHLQTQGLMFFLTLPGPEDMSAAFDEMLATAQALAETLDGDVLDDTRSVMTKQYIEATRQTIREFATRHRP